MKALWDAPLITIIFVFLIAVGAVDLLIDGSLSGDYTKFLKAIDVPLAGVAVGRGLAARKPGVGPNE